MKKNNILVNHPQQLNKIWAQRVVNQYGHHAKIRAVHIAHIDVGTTTRVRLAVEYETATTLAKQWFVKIPSLNWRARLITALPRLLHTEVRFYNEIAPVVPLTIPKCLAAQSQLGRGATVVLADVDEVFGRPGQPSDALSVEQARAVITQLAIFHARFWDHPQLYTDYGWLAGSVRKLEDALGTLLAVPLMKRGLKLAGALVPPSLHAPALRYAKQRRNIMAFLNDAPHTLVHHDCHPGNLFWQQQHVGFLDWQLVRLGEGVSDVAYFLCTALLPQTRREHEEDLLKLYAQTLQEQGVSGVTFAHLMQRYRAHCSYAFEAMLVTLAVGGMMNLESNLELIRRSATAVQDLATFSVLPT